MRKPRRILRFDPWVATEEVRLEVVFFEETISPAAAVFHVYPWNAFLNPFRGRPMLAKWRNLPSGVEGVRRNLMEHFVRIHSEGE